MFGLFPIEGMNKLLECLNTESYAFLLQNQRFKHLRPFFKFFSKKKKKKRLFLK